MLLVSTCADRPLISKVSGLPFLFLPLSRLQRPSGRVDVPERLRSGHVPLNVITVSAANVRSRGGFSMLAAAGDGPWSTQKTGPAPGDRGNVPPVLNHSHREQRSPAEGEVRGAGGDDR